MKNRRDCTFDDYVLFLLEPIASLDRAHARPTPFLDTTNA